ncbi:LPXTG cell wall anchor domain-containing protein, partial [Mycobacterium tuberculosis]|nr:LPXTG cell wall anchor domain-containing protein [Mycobacterium tuberculosis]
ENAGSLPRTGADLGQYLLIGGVAAGLIALGVVAFLVTRRR